MADINITAQATQAIREMQRLTTAIGNLSRQLTTSVGSLNQLDAAITKTAKTTVDVVTGASSYNATLKQQAAAAETAAAANRDLAAAQASLGVTQTRAHTTNVARGLGPAAIDVAGGGAARVQLTTEEQLVATLREQFLRRQELLRSQKQSEQGTISQNTQHLRQLAILRDFIQAEKARAIAAKALTSIFKDHLRLQELGRLETERAVEAQARAARLARSGPAVFAPSVSRETNVPRGLQTTDPFQAVSAQQAQAVRQQTALRSVFTSNFNSLASASETSSKRITDAFGANAAAVQRASAATVGAAQQSSTALTRIRESAASLGRVAGISLFIGAVFELQFALREALRTAIEFSQSIAEIQTIQDTTALSVGQWTTQLRELSNAYGIPIVDQAEAAYQALSNQVVKSAESTEVFLNAANELATVAQTDVTNAVSLLSSAINSYSLDVEDASLISAQFFKTVELGRLRIEDIADSLGRVSVAASQVGISTTEVNAALATLTVQGVKPNESLTLLRNVIQKLIRPSEALKNLFREQGFASVEAALSALSFGEILQLLQNTTKGSATEIGELFQRIRAIQGVLGFAGEGLETFNRNLAKIDAANIEDFGNKVGLVLDSAGRRLDIEINKIRNFFLIDFGQQAIEVLANVAQAFGGVENIIAKTVRVVGALAAVLGGAVLVRSVQAARGVLLAFQIELLLFNERMLGAAVASTGLLAALRPFLKFAGLAGVALVALEVFESLTESIRASADGIGVATDRAKELNKELSKLDRERTKELTETFELRAKAFAIGQAEIRKELFKTQDEAVKSFEDIERALKLVTKGVETGLNQQASEFTKFARQAGNNVRKVTRVVEDLEDKIDESDLKLNLELGTDASDIRTLTREIGRVSQAANEAFIRAQTSQDPKVRNAGAARFGDLKKQLEDLSIERLKAESETLRQEADLRVRFTRSQLALQLALSSGDTEAREKAIKTLRRLRAEQNLSIDLTEEQRDLELKLFDARQSLREALTEGVSNERILAIRQEITLIRQAGENQQANIDAQRAGLEKLNKEREEGLKQLRDLQIAEEQRQAAQARQAAELRTQRELLNNIQKDIGRFDLEETLKIEDQDKLTTALQEQLSLLKQAALVNADSLKNAALEDRLRDQTAKLREAGEARLKELKLNSISEEFKANEKALAEAFSRASVLNSQQRQGLTVALAEVQTLATLPTLQRLERQLQAAGIGEIIDGQVVTDLGIALTRLEQAGQVIETSLKSGIADPASVKIIERGFTAAAIGLENALDKVPNLTGFIELGESFSGDLSRTVESFENILTGKNSLKTLADNLSELRALERIVQINSAALDTIKNGSEDTADTVKTAAGAIIALRVKLGETAKRFPTIEEALQITLEDPDLKDVEAALADVAIGLGAASVDKFGQAAAFSIAENLKEGIVAERLGETIATQFIETIESTQLKAAELQKEAAQQQADASDVIERSIPRLTRITTGGTVPGFERSADFFARTRKGREAEGLPGRRAFTSDDRSAATELAKLVGGTPGDAKGLLDSFAIDLRQTLKDVELQTLPFPGGGPSPLPESVRTVLQNNLQIAGELFQQIKSLEGTSATFDALRTVLGDTRTLLNDLATRDLSGELKNTFTEASQTLADFTQKTGELNRPLLEILLEIAREVRTSRGQPFAEGGVVHGPGGHDRVPAMLTAGEFVMNRKSTGKFYSQLLAMNSGRVTPGFANGGLVTNVGGINVEVNESSSPQATARQVAAEINRGIRQRTIRIRG